MLFYNTSQIAIISRIMKLTILLLLLLLLLL